MDQLGDRPRVRVLTGDVHASLLRPHQVLISSHEAARLAIPVLSLVRIQAASQDATTRSSCLLEVVGDPRAPAQGGLDAGVVQVHPWVLDALNAFDGESVHLSRVDPVDHIKPTFLCELVLAVVTRSPLRTAYSSSSTTSSTTTTTTSSSSSSSSSSDGVAAAAASLLPDSVRSGLVDMRKVLNRQLRMMYQSLTQLTPGDLVPIQLMGETFIFRVVRAQYEDERDGEPERLDICVLGCSTSTTASATTASVDSLNAAMRDLQLSDGSYSNTDNNSNALAMRLARGGFAGYTEFMQDTLFHVLLNFLPSQQDATATATASATNGSACVPTNGIPTSLACHGLLLHGVQGVGKSLALCVMDAELQRHSVATWRVDAMSLLMEFENSKVASAYEFLRARFQQCIPASEGVVLIDDVDVLFQPTNGQENDSDGSSDDQSGLPAIMPLGSALLRVLDAMGDRHVRQSQRLCVIGTTTTGASSGGDDNGGDDKIPVIARRSGRFDKSIEMIVPTEAMRRAILARHLSDLPLEQPVDKKTTVSPSSQEDCTTETVAWSLATRLAALTGGYVAKDLVRICRSAYIQARTSQQNGSSRGEVTWDRLLSAQRHIKPSQLQQLNVASPSTTDATGDDTKTTSSPFAGYEALRKQLGDFIQWKFHPSDAMQQLGVANASGLLIHGPSGCGKSLLVQTLAAHAKVNFVSVKSSELLSKYFGDSERAVRQLFARARAASPCLLFFDEFDSIAHKRSFGSGSDGGGDGSGVYARILSTFLNEMDGVGAARDRVADVLVVAATNRMDALDAALIRPGRIDKCVELAFPERDDRLAILQYYTRRMPLADDVDLAALADRSTGQRTISPINAYDWLCARNEFDTLRTSWVALGFSERMDRQVGKLRLKLLMSAGSAPTTPAAAARLLSPTAAPPPAPTSAPSLPSVMAARNEAIEWRSVVLTHKVTLEHAAVDIDTDRVLYHMELEFETPLPPDVMQHAQFLCLTWPYGGLWKIERVSDNNTRVKCLSWRKTDLTRQQVDELAKQVDALAIKVEADEGDEHSALMDEELHDQTATTATTTTPTTPEPPQEDLPTLFEWKMMRGEWNDDVSHWFLRSVDPPVPAASASASAMAPMPLAKRDLVAKLFVDFDPLEARIEVNAVTAIDTVAQTYSADVTWQVTLPAITALREDSVLREFLDILEIDASQFEFTNISEMNDQRELMSSVTLAGDAEFRDLTQPGGDGATVENVYNLQFSRRVIATFTEEMALHSFPFDQQKLVFEFSTGNSGMANTALRLTPTPVEPGSFSIDNYQLGNVFDVAYHNKVFVSAIQETGPKKSIAFEMVLERRSAYYLTNVALIAAVITYLCFVTYAPVGDGAGDDDEYMDTGSRLQIVTALVLTAVTFKNQVASLIPQVSYFTTLDKYVFFCFMVTSLVTLENALFPLYRKLVTQGTASENGLLGFSIGMFTLVNVVWSLYLRRWYNRRRIAARVLLQVHEYIRVITETIPPKYREDVLRRFLVHKSFEDWCIPAFVVTSNGDVHIQAPDDVPQDEDFATKAKTVAAITQQKQEALSEQNTFKKIYLDLRPGLDRRASAPVASSPVSHGVFTGGGGSRVNEKKPFVVDRSLSGNAMELTVGGAGGAGGGRRSHSANTYFHESSVDVQHPFHRHRNGSNKRSSTRRAL